MNRAFGLFVQLLGLFLLWLVVYGAMDPDVHSYGFTVAPILMSVCALVAGHKIGQPSMYGRGK